jgi:hypothetical protein
MDGVARGGQPARLPPPARPGRAERPRDHACLGLGSAGLTPTSPRARSRCQISGAACDDLRVCTTFRKRTRLNHRIPDCGATGNHPSRGRYLGATREFVAGRAQGAVPALQLPSKDQSRSDAVGAARCLPRSRRRRRSCSPLRLGEPALAGDCQFQRPSWSEDRMLVRSAMSCRRHRAPSTSGARNPGRSPCGEHGRGDCFARREVAALTIELATFASAAFAGLAATEGCVEQPCLRQASTRLRFSDTRSATLSVRLLLWCLQRPGTWLARDASSSAVERSWSPCELSARCRSVGHPGSVLVARPEQGSRPIRSGFREQPVHTAGYA